MTVFLAPFHSIVSLGIGDGMMGHSLSLEQKVCFVSPNIVPSRWIRISYTQSLFSEPRPLLSTQGRTGGETFVHLPLQGGRGHQYKTFLRISDSTFLAQIPFTSHSSVT